MDSKDQRFDDFLEGKKKESGEKYPFISDSEMNEFIEGDPFYAEMMRRIKVVNKMIETVI